MAQYSYAINILHRELARLDKLKNDNKKVAGKRAALLGAIRLLQEGV